MSDFEEALSRYLAALRTVGVPDWIGPADEADVAELIAAVAPLVLPDQLLTLWLHVSELQGWLVDAGDLMSPRTSMESWQQLRSADMPPFPTTLLPIAYAGHAYLTVELGVPEMTTGGALLRVPFEEIEPVAPDMATALGLASSAIEDGRVQWSDGWWEGVDFESLQQETASSLSWPVHLASVDTAVAILPLTWPAVWQHAAGLDPADAVPRGADSTIQDLEAARPGAELRITARVHGIHGSSAGALLSLEDESAAIRCWCPSSADPFLAARRADVIEVDVRVQHLGATTVADSELAFENAPQGRFVATFVRPSNFDGHARPAT